MKKVFFPRTVKGVKHAVLILIILSTVVGCKKYENDPFISTFTPESRLTKGDSCMWECTGYMNDKGEISSVPANHYGLIFNSDGMTVRFFNHLKSFQEPVNYSTFEGRMQYFSCEVLNTGNWNFEESKNYLECFGRYKILSLTMNKLEIQNEKGAIYFFEKKRLSSSPTFDPSILNIPLMGVFPETCSIFSYNSCENGSNWFTSLPVNSNFSFNKFFNKKGYITLYFQKSIINNNLGLLDNQMPIFKLNGQEAIYEISENGLGDISNPNKIWHVATIKVTTTGNQTLEIKTVGSHLTSIDEIKYWEIE
jgi:hypothetical protein